MVKRLLLALVLIALATGATLVATQRPTIPARLDVAPISAQKAAVLLTQSTVQVLAFGCDLSNRQGSAVLIGPGRLLTNAHVVVGSREVDLSADGFPTVVAPAPSVAKAGDVAVVAAPSIDAAGVTLAGSDPEVGDVVRVAGFPSAPLGDRPIGLKISSAEVIGTLPGAAVGEPWPLIRLSVPVQEGMSGVPVLNQQGRLAGIIIGNEVPTGQALAIPVSALRQVLDGGDVVAAACS